MVEFFVDERTQKECDKRISDSKRVHFKRGNGSVKNNESEILNIYVNRVEIENVPIFFGKTFNRIEDCRHIHKKHREYAPKILHISEEYEKRREDKSDTDVEYNETTYRNDKKKERKCKLNVINYTEDKEYCRKYVFLL